MKNKNPNEVNFDLNGTPVTIDKNTVIFTGLLVGGAGLLVDVGAYWLALAVLLTSMFAYAHEFSHYLIARDHNLPVKAIRFMKNKNEIEVGGLVSHLDTRDIALGGEVTSGIYVMAMGACFFYFADGIMILQVVAFIFPVAWVLSWLSKDSDMNRAIKADQYHKMQAGIE